MVGKQWSRQWWIKQFICEVCELEYIKFFFIMHNFIAEAKYASYSASLSRKDHKY
jgi:hypothetical protein